MPHRLCFPTRRSGSLIGRSGSGYYELKYMPRLTRIAEREDPEPSDVAGFDGMGMMEIACPSLDLMSFLSPIVVPVLIVMGILYVQSLLDVCVGWVLYAYRKNIM